MKQILATSENIKVYDLPAPLLQSGTVLVEVNYSFISSGTELTTLNAIQSKTDITDSNFKKNSERLKKLVSHLQSHGIKKTISVIQERISSNGTGGEILVPLGYSCSGRVVSIGEGVTLFKPGDLVACAGANKATHSELVVVPENLVVHVPKECSMKDASSVAVGAIAMQAVRRSEVALGESVAVIGLGLVGLLNAKMLQCSGARVLGIDIDETRVDKAKALGINEACSEAAEIHRTVNNFTRKMGVDVCLVAAGSKDNSILQTATEITRKKGRVVIVGLVPMQFDINPFLRKELDLLASISCGPGRYDDKYEEKGFDYPYAYVRWTEKRNMEEYLRLLAQDKIDLSMVASEEFAIDNAVDAYDLLEKGNAKSTGIFINYASDSSLKEKSNTRVDVNEKPVGDHINLAVIGAGNFTKRVHLPNLKKLGNNISIGAIVSRTGANAMQAAEQYGANYATSSFEDVLADPEIDTVLIGTRHNLHADMTIKSLQAGKNVLVEKPLAMSGEELLAIEEFYKAKNAAINDGLPILMVGFNRRFSPMITKLKTVVSERITPLIMNYQMNAGFLPADHWLRTEEGGGRNIGEACHIYDLFTFLTESEVSDIKVSSINIASDEHADNENFTATLSFADGSVGSLTLTSLGSSKYPKEVFHVYANEAVHILTDYRQLESVGGDSKVIRSDKVEKGHFEELEAFVYVLKNGGHWPIPLWQQVQASRIAFTVEEQIKGGI
jgi:predicted dehydrogenase/threonine dehydrogenase-like Zn-dependent dehydrogenase